MSPSNEDQLNRWHERYYIRLRPDRAMTLCESGTSGQPDGHHTDRCLTRHTEHEYPEDVG